MPDVKPPTGTPVAEGPQRAGAQDVRWALTKARRYLHAGGPFDAVAVYVDAWLDYALDSGHVALVDLDRVPEPA